MQNLNNQICNLSTLDPLKNSCIDDNKGLTNFSNRFVLDAIDETMKIIISSSIASNKALNAHLALEYFHHNQDIHSLHHPVPNDCRHNQGNSPPQSQSPKGLIRTLSNKSNLTKKTISSDTSPCFKWSETALERLLLYLKENIEVVRSLDKRNNDGTKQKIWNGASEELRKESHEYTSRRCSIKWKNIKQNYIKWLKESGSGEKKPDIEEIIANELLKLSLYVEITGCNKRTIADKEDNLKRRNPKKRRTM
ncbi:hypothetical protein RclHR1_09040003 [Rhizophagus clarus]|uniref:Myb-like domain-containing protein n=1 Tax=Rhizophagus clarus TaxID=94130 RepID=A0A2Z6S322_9GLOM|nr:hypothetical protein RclHR1_09040003 [Rhizophagus clarus]GES73841.1 hypothetical protein GLOIN_2v1588679 [Rhizophagus clarus]